MKARHIVMKKNHKLKKISMADFITINQALGNFWNKGIQSIFQKSYQNLSFCDVLTLKQMLSQFNNIATGRLSLAFVAWLQNINFIGSNQASNMVKQIWNSNPNANGYDIAYAGTRNIVAEVKCNVPMRIGKLGSNKKVNIDQDIYNLLNGKKSGQVVPTNYYKFMVMLDCAYQPIAGHLKNKWGSSINVLGPSSTASSIKKLNVVHIVPFSVIHCNICNGASNTSSTAHTNASVNLGMDVEAFLKFVESNIDK